MKTIYVQHLLKVLLEEYEDIDYMLETVAAENPTRRESEKIRRLLNRLSQQNEKLLHRFEG
ncbi:MAG: hypothetical protein WD603_03260 [Patescibacteria group bacterium]